jgi:hypothetical protein
MVVVEGEEEDLSVVEEDLLVDVECPVQEEEEE